MKQRNDDRTYSGDRLSGVDRFEGDTSIGRRECGNNAVARVSGASEVRFVVERHGNREMLR